MAPVPGNWKVVDEVSATLLSLPGEQEWILGGDFNCLPCENPLSPNLLGVSCDIFHPDVPTRWSSNRCIDYFCSNTKLSQVCALAHKVSDHKIVSVSWQGRLQQGDDYVVQTPPVLPKLGDEQPDSFTEAVEEAWRAESSALLSDGSVDLKWEVLNKALYQTLLRAHKKCGTNHELNLRDRKFARGKPTKVTVRRRQVAHRPAAGHFTSFHQRTIRNLLGRMLEFRQRRQGEQPSVSSLVQTQKLWNKIVRSPGYDDRSNLTRNIQRLERELERCVAEENANRLQRWRIEGPLWITMLFGGFADSLPKQLMPCRFPRKTLLLTAHRKPSTNSSPSGKRCGTDRSLTGKLFGTRWSGICRLPSFHKGGILSLDPTCNAPPSVVEEPRRA